jgi:hypothetical protein
MNREIRYCHNDECSRQYIGDPRGGNYCSTCGDEVHDRIESENNPVGTIPLEEIIIPKNRLKRLGGTPAAKPEDEYSGGELLFSLIAYSAIIFGPPAIMLYGMLNDW